eukprot:353465-Chlamydomonas_euryale.AAC.5
MERSGRPSSLLHLTRYICVATASFARWSSGWCSVLQGGVQVGVRYCKVEFEIVSGIGIQNGIEGAC